MSEDMSSLINQINQMIKNNQIPEEIQNIVNNLSSQSDFTSNSENHSKQKNINSVNDSISSTENTTENSNQIPDIDIATIMKIKKMMDSMNSNKDDPRSNLLRSLKPYLKESRQSKLDQYIQIFNISKMFEVLGPLGGDNKK